jgi:hypothetical protein
MIFVIFVITIIIATIIGITSGIMTFPYLPQLGSVHDRGEDNNADPYRQKRSTESTCIPDCISNHKQCGGDGCGGSCGECTVPGEKRVSNFLTCSEDGSCVRKPTPMWKEAPIPTTENQCTAAGNDMFALGPLSTDCAGCCAGLKAYLIHSQAGTEPRFVCYSPDKKPDVGANHGQLIHKDSQTPPCMKLSEANWLEKGNFKYKGDTASQYRENFNKHFEDTETHTDCGTLGLMDSCPSDTTEINQSSCGFLDLGRRRTCVKTQWDVKTKEACCGNSITVQDSTRKLDIDKCALVDTKQETRVSTVKDMAWAPWSKDCTQSNTMLSYCGAMDPVHGKSRLMTLGVGGRPGYCQQWCQDNPVLCDKAKTQYCTKYPNMPECICWDPQHNVYYQELMTQAQDLSSSLGIPPNDSPSVCWLPACQGQDVVNVLLTTKMQRELLHCPDTSNNICSQIIQVKNSKAQRIIIDHNNFNIVCNKNND